MLFHSTKLGPVCRKWDNEVNAKRRANEIGQRVRLSRSVQLVFWLTLNLNTYKFVVAWDPQDMGLYKITYFYEFGLLFTNARLIEWGEMAKISIFSTFSSHENAFDYFVSQNYYILLLPNKAYQND